ncbi:hypothetical protein BG015_007813 [Linnemannia schmuckeri]|uniref:DNA primase/polymerase bifunctional N-terminal domain-containing protein n=1 Tax=Linnemannia schmuckeri TaxID=64567 RepID=A0A9P5RXV9_9FUNG|nr:hypothetical protein BG015_007813 [Linnemannia schmuckeri]
MQQLNMEVCAKTLTELGYVPIGIRLQWMQQTSRKKIDFKPLWQRASLGTYRNLFSPDDNGTVLVTGGASNLIVIDCDVLKDPERDSGVQDGLVLFQELVKQHGIPEDTPVQRTASGSLEQGLQKAGNSTKLKINGTPSSIDTRADGGCIIIASSQVDGRRLPAATALHRSAASNAGVMSTLNFESAAEQQLSVFFNDVKSVIKKTLRTEIARTWAHANLNGFDFKPLSIMECALCGTMYKSNNYLVRQIIEDCFFMGNYSIQLQVRRIQLEQT